MSRSIVIESVIVDLAANPRNAHHAEGYPVDFGVLTHLITQKVREVHQQEVLDALKGLFQKRYINLRKWDETGKTLNGYRDFDPKNDNDGVFFFTGTFFIQRTLYSSTYLEQFVRL